jgi:hypothetical protein
LAQVTSVGADVFHWDRRCRVLLRDIRRFGTATINLLVLVHLLMRSRLVVRPRLKSCPPRIDRGVVAVLRILVQVGPAFGTQTQTVRATQRLERQIQHDRIAQHRLEVEQVTLQVPDLVLGVGVARFVAGIDVQLLEIDDRRVGQIHQAPNALPRQPDFGRTGDQHALDHRFEPQIELHR